MLKVFFDGYGLAEVLLLRGVLPIKLTMVQSPLAHWPLFKPIRGFTALCLYGLLAIFSLPSGQL